MDGVRVPAPGPYWRRSRRPSVVSLGQGAPIRALPGDLCRWRGVARAAVALAFDDGPRPRSRLPYSQTTGATMVEARRRHGLRLVLWSGWAGKDLHRRAYTAMTLDRFVGLGP